MKFSFSHQNKPSVRRPKHNLAKPPVRHGRFWRVKNFYEKYRKLPLWKKIFIVVWPIAILLIFVAVVTTIVFASALGSKESLMNRNHTGVTLTDRNDKVFYEFDNARSDTYVPLSDIALFVQKAVVSSEDKDFYKHPGFSIVGIGNAIYQNIIRAGGGGGGSTITQQLVTSAMLSKDDRSPLRKYQELILSLEVERRYSKNEILEMYLNSVYFGEGAFGIEDAAQTYFGKSAKDLDNAQAAILIGLLPAPSAYSPISGSMDMAKARQKYVLNRMKQDGVINADQEKAAIAEELTFQKPAEDTTQAPHFALMVKQWLEEKYGEEQVARSGYKVKTTLDLNDQSMTEAAVKKQVDKLSSSNVTNGAAVIIDPKSGDVLALVGSADWNNETNGKLNMATATRQPGSSFKPFVYGTGIQNREMTAATIFADVAKDFGGYKPKDYDGRYRGDVTLRRALANSLNIPAVEAMQTTGIDAVIQNAKKAGLTTLDKTADEYGLPLALGSGQARLTEMTNAYAAFANEGKKNDLQLVISITDKNDKQIYKQQIKSTDVWSPGTAYIVSSILSDNSARAETFGSSLTVASNRPVAVKTGTTEDYRDAWTIGYTPSLAVGVWIGNNDNAPMSSVAGSSGAAPIWVSLMRQILQGSDIEKFTQPSTVVSRDVCSDNGALAQNAGDNTYTEYFLSGTLPTATCNESKKEQEKPSQNQSQQNQDKPKDTTVPTVPTGLTATATSSTAVTLKWTASTDTTGVTGYRIYRDGKQIATSTTPNYADTGLVAQTTYSYSIVAYDAAGNVSGQSAAAVATTPTATSAPTADMDATGSVR